MNSIIKNQSNELISRINYFSRKKPDCVAIKSSNYSYTYRTLAEEIHCFYEEFKKININKNDIVGLMFVKKVDMLISLYALQQIQIPVILINNTYKNNELNNIIGLTEASVIITDKFEIREWFDGDINFCKAGICFRIKQNNERNGILYKQEDFIVQFSSGTDGEPKISVRTYEAILKEIQQTIKFLNITYNDSFMTLTPIYHSYGLVLGSLVPLYIGATLVLPNNFDVFVILDLLKKEKPSIFIAVPYMYDVLLQLIEKRIEHNLWNKNYWTACVNLSAGAVLNKQLFEHFYRVIGKKLSVDYGSTETGVMCINLNPDKYIEGNVGKTVDGIEIGIFNEKNEKLSNENKGIVKVRSKWISKRYIYPLELNITAFKNGWFSTNDIGYYNINNELVLEGRQNDIIVSAGNKIDPSEVAQVIKKMDIIKEAIVIGIIDKKQEESVIAFVTSETVISGKKIRIFCKKYLSEFKIPRQVIQVDCIPKTQTGKIIKSELIKMYYEILEE